MTPLVHPPYEYVSRPPYIVTHEWPDRHVSTACPTVYHAVVAFWQPDFSSEGSALERLMVDARGAHVFGWRDDVEDIYAWSMTDEMRRVIERLAPQHMAQIFEMEMATRGLNIERELRKEGHAPHRL